MKLQAFGPQNPKTCNLITGLARKIDSRSTAWAVLHGRGPFKFRILRNRFALARQSGLEAVILIAARHCAAKSRPRPIVLLDCPTKLVRPAAASPTAEMEAWGTGTSPLITSPLLFRAAAAVRAAVSIRAAAIVHEHNVCVRISARSGEGHSPRTRRGKQQHSRRDQSKSL